MEARRPLLICMTLYVNCLKRQTVKEEENYT